MAITQTFSQATINGTSLNNPTSLQFGPDGRLYVSQQNGILKVYDVTKDGATWQASNEQVINLVNDIPNHNDDGSLNTQVNNRQVTGLVVEGTAQNPILYVSSSDPRIGAGGGGNDVNLDTNSGIISRLTFDGSQWQKVDLVIGLPRSEENHSTNGLDIRTESVEVSEGVFEQHEIMYVMSGGHDNKGAPSNNFAYTPEYYYSAALLRVDLTQLAQIEANEGLKGGTDYVDEYVYALPTLDDPTRTNVSGIGDSAVDSAVGTTGPADLEAGNTFGGNDGRNQAKFDQGGPVQVYSPGYRNAYDVVITEAGNLYTFDNGPNNGWGGAPVSDDGANEVTSDTQVATNAPNLTDNTNDSDPDNLHIIESGTYGGHPNPTRASGAAAGLWSGQGGGLSEDVQLTPAGTPGNDPGTIWDDLPEDWSTITGGTTNPIEGVYFGPDNSPGPKDESLLSINSSSNGITEYTADNIGDGGPNVEYLAVVSLNGSLTLMEIQTDGTAANSNVTDTDTINVGGSPLDVTALGNSGIPGSAGVGAGAMFVAQFGTNNIIVLEPGDPPGVDVDADNDGVLDKNDPLQFDPNNGTQTVLQGGQTLFWDFNPAAGNNPGPSGEYNIGMNGWMVDGSGEINPDVLIETPGADLLTDLDNTIRGGAPGVIQIKQVTDGDAFQNVNTQNDAIQTGFTPAADVGTFTIRVPIFNPYSSVSLDQNFGSVGFALGDGTQSNYLKVVAGVGGGLPRLQVFYEENDAEVTDITVNSSQDTDFNDAANNATDNAIFNLYLTVDLTSPGAATAQASYNYELSPGGGMVLAQPKAIGGPIALQGKVLDAVLGNNTIMAENGNKLPSSAIVTLLATSTGPETPFEANFADLEITSTVQQVAPVAVDDEASTSPDQAVDIPVADLLANDSDANVGDALSITSVQNASNGSAVLNDNGTTSDTSDDFVTFTPTGGFEGDATFEYTINDGTGLTDDATVTVTVADSEILYRVNAGGAEVAATDDGPDWAANTGVGAQSGPGFSNNTGNLSSPSAVNPASSPAENALPGYVPLAIFSTERWDPGANPEMEYVFDALIAGVYTVNLFMADGFSGTTDVGDRVFDISIEGQLVEDNLDLVETIGDQVAGLFSYDVTVNDGSLNILWEHVTENPLINGIEILGPAGGPLPDTTPPVVDTIDVQPLSTDPGNDQPINVLVTFTDNEGLDVDSILATTLSVSGGPIGTDSTIVNVLNGAVDGDTTIDAEYIVDAPDGGWPANTLYTFEVSGVTDQAGNTVAAASEGYTFLDAATPGTPLYRVNAGGPELAAADGSSLPWSADTGNFPSGGNSPFLVANSTGGSTYSTSAGTAVSVTSFDPGIAASAPAEIFNTERYDAGSDPEMQWAFDVAAGDYVVNLFFAEIFSGITAADQRQFDISVEGTVPAEFDDVDPYETAGSGGAYMLSHTVNVTDGTLNLEFIHDIENPSLKGIEIVAAGEPAYTPPADNLFGNVVEIADDGMTPTDAGALSPGNNIVIAQQEGENGENNYRDRDYFTFEIPDGYGLTAIELEDYQFEGSLFTDAFFALQAGTQVTVEPTTQDPTEISDLLGGVIYGTGNLNPGNENLLALMAAGGDIQPGFSLPSFETPLTGEITAWMNSGYGPSTATLNFVVEALPLDPGTIIAAINAGGPALSQDGIDFSADQSFLNGQTFTDNNAGNGQQPVFDATVYETERYADPLNYEIPVAPGDYTVELYFAEIFQSNPGARVFNVFVEDVLVLDDFDILAQTGDFNVPFVFDVPGTFAPDTAGNPTALDIDFDASVDNAKVSGIVVREAGAPVANGAAELSITLSADNVQTSNFGANSFQLTNTGTKDIEKVELDVTNALYPDSVFDPFGEAGDTTAKLLTINTPGSTGVIAPDHGTSGAPGTTYIGAGGTAGFEGIQLLFDAATDGGFNPGETIGFAVDMDPNSIAGAEKSTLDSGADPTWDIGGISGAELIGSSFTVTFTDGTTATGQLQGAGNQGGSQGLATQAPAGPAVSLTVNGLTAGGVGAYGAGGPSVIVNGPAGQTARVVLTKGIIQPVTNEFSTGTPAEQTYAPILQAQLDALAASDFPANNAAEFQTVDVVLTGSDQDISGLFDFTQVPVYELAVDEGQVPLGLVASVIDPSNDDLAIGPVSAPIYLQFNNPPDAIDDAFATDEDVVLAGDVLADNGLGADTDPDDSDALTISEVNGAALDMGQQITLTSGALLTLNADGTFSYDPNGAFDSLATGETDTDSFNYTLTDGAASDTATVTVTINGVGFPADDIDGDGILNTEDPFAFDGSNGDAKALLPGGEFLQDFNTDTTDPFSTEAGFSGIIVNPAFDPPGTSGTDPYGDRTTEAGFSIAGGFLNVDSSGTDLFADSGTDANNTIKDNYQSAADVTGVDTFEVVARTANPFLGGAPASFASFGITLGAGGVDDYIKFVYGGAGDGPRVQLAQEDSLTGVKEENISLGSASIDPPLVKDIEFQLVVDKLAGTLQGTATLFDDLGAELGAIQTGVRTVTGSLVDALNGVNPLTGADGGIAYGISITDWSGAPQFTGQWDFLRLTALDELPADLALTKTVSDLAPEFGDDVTFTLTVDHEDGVEATGVQVEDLLADGFSFVSASGDGTYDDGTGLWDIGTIPIGGSATLDITATVNEAGVVGDVVVYRVNPGGTTQAAADASAPGWLGDTLGAAPTAGAYGPGITLTAGGNKFGNENGSPVIDLTQLPASDPAGAVLFETERFGDQQWDFAVDNGNYTVNLYFAEIFANAPGARVFDVEVEGALVLDDYDIFVDAGNANNTAVRQSFTTTVADGILDIDLTTVTDNAKISAIEIIQEGVAQVFDYDNYAQILAADQPDLDSTPGDGSIGDDDDASVTLSPVPAVNEVTLAATQDASEPGTNGQFTVSLEEIASTVTTVSYTVTGTATSGVDFDTLSGTVDIAQGDTSATIDVTVIDDLEIEGPETVIITLDGVAGDADLALGAASSGTITIADDDVVNEVTIAATANAAEPDQDGQFTVSLGAAATTNTVIDLTVSGTATPDVDYTGLPTSVTILQGETSALLDVAVLDDLDLEGIENVQVTLDGIAAGDANVVIGALDSATVDILDDEFDVGATIQVNGVTTFGTNALTIQNTSPGDVSIKSIVFDLGTAILSEGLDLSGVGEFLGSVWDPTGEAGDTGSQGLKFNTNEAGLVDDLGNILPAPTTAGLGFTGVAGVYPFSEQLPGGDDGAPGGFRLMTLDFDNFDAGESFIFGVDVDPQSIQGAIGTGQAGAVSGGEIAGTTITITFENATGQEVTVTRELELTGLNTSQAIFDGVAALAAPTLTIDGLIDGERRALTTETTQTVEISGAPAGATVELYVMDASGYEKHGDNGTETIPDDPFHANQLDTAPLILSGTADAGGNVSFVVDLGNGVPGDAPATVDDLFFLSAGVVDVDGNLISGLTETAELKLVEPPAVPIYDAPGVMDFDGTAGTVLQLAPDPALNVDQGTVAFSFNASDTNGDQGLFSKDASGFGDGGHLAIYLDDNDLKARFQNASADVSFTVGGIVAGTEYEVAATFGPSGVELWIDGALVASDGLPVDWLQNDEYLQWGGRGWGSKAGAPGFDAPFQGTISDKQIYGEVLSQDQILELASFSSGTNNPPVAADDAFVLDEDTVDSGNVLADNGNGADSDVDGNPLSVTPGSFITTQGGTFDVDALGDFTYTPAADFNGTDTVDYTLSDGQDTDTATVTFTVNPVNDDPVANDDTVSTVIDAEVTIDVTANDVDVDGDTLIITDVDPTTVNGGVVVENPDGTVTYTPGMGFLGTDSFMYTVSDGSGGALASAEVTVTVLAAPNEAPNAQDDVFSVLEDTILLGDVLADNENGADSDPNGDTLDVALGTDVTNGSLVLNADGTFSYTPNADFNGSDSFTYTASDGFLTDTATVNITVDPVNDDPVANDDSVSARQGVATDFDVLSNDSDIDGDGLTVTEATTPANGNVVINPDGTIGYTSDPGFEGVDTFDYTVSDGNGGEDTATVTVDVSAFPVPIYDAPGVMDFDGTAGTVLQLAPDPALNVDQGTVAFSFNASDTNGDQGLFSKDASGFGDGGHLAIYLDDNDLKARFQNASADVSFTVGGIVAGTEYEVAATFGPSGVELWIDGALVASDGLPVDWLQNDEYLQWGGRGWGSKAGAPGFDAPFQGTISDKQIYGEVLSQDQILELASFSSGTNNPPVAADDAFVLDEDTVDSGNVLADNGNGADSDVDGNPLSVTPGSFITTQGGTFDVDALGDFTYTPAADFNGTDTVDYTLSDGQDTDTATVTFTVNPVNDDPVANDDTVSTVIDAEVTIDVTANDVDVDGDTLIITDVDPTTVNGGVVVENPDGTVTYTPGMGFLGTDSFMYTVSDGSGGALASAEVTVTVLAAPNEAPNAQDDVFSVLEDTILLGDVLADNENGADSDPNGDTLDVALGTDVTNGSLVLNADGTFSYTPNADFNGSDSFTYTASDGFLTDTATVNITVDPVNDDPVANDDSVSARQGVATDFDVLSNDSDIDGDGLTVTEATTPANGNVVINPDGTIGYTSDPGFEGVDTFDYTVSDGNGGEDTATVTVDVSAFPVPIYDAPGVMDFDGTAGTVLQLAPDPALNVDQGTVAFSFNASDTNGDQGLFSKDASGFGDGGHLAIYLDDNDLKARFQNASADVSFTVGGIVAGTEYEVAATFGPSGVELWIDGALVASDGLPVDWLQNDEYLQWGGRGWGSKAGAPGFDAPFQGTISDKQIYGEVLSQDQILELASFSSGTNNPPVAADDAFVLDEDTVDSGNVLADNGNGADSDVDGNPLSVTPGSFITTQGGTFDVDALGDFTYTPAADFNGTDTVDYTLSDGQDTDTATVTFTVNPVNDDPVANDDVVSTVTGATGDANVALGAVNQAFDGSDVGLNTNAENIDGLAVDPVTGNLLISTIKNVRTPALNGNPAKKGKDEDVWRFAPSELGSNTVGTWSLEFDGSDLGLNASSNGDIDAIGVRGNDLFLSTFGDFILPPSVTDPDVFSFTGTYGPATSGTFETFFNELSNNGIDNAIGGIG